LRRLLSEFQHTTGVSLGDLTILDYGSVCIICGIARPLERDRLWRFLEDRGAEVLPLYDRPPCRDYGLVAQRPAEPASPETPA
jgi:hypothetical protein